MKVLRYEIADEINIGTKEKPNFVQNKHEVIVPWSKLYEEIARKEAYNGEITIEDDGQPEHEPTEGEKLRADVAELKEALDLLLSGVTE